MAEEALLPASAAFSPGRVLNTSFGVFGRNLPAFLAIAAIISLPYIGLQTWIDILLMEPGAERAGGLIAGNFGILVVQAVTFGFVQAALTYGTVQDLRGQRAGIGACFRHGLAHSGNVASGAVQYGIMIGLATLLLVVPGIILYVRWWVFMPAMVVEELTPGDSFGRSRELTAGRRWAIFGLVALIFVVQVAVMIGLALLIESFVDGLTSAVAMTLLAVFFSSFSSVVAAVGYYHLRMEKEGVIIDDIAKVFD